MANTPPPVVVLPVEDWQTVIDGLSELPYKRVVTLIGSIAEQVNRQAAAPNTSPPAQGDGQDV